MDKVSCRLCLERLGRVPKNAQGQPLAHLRWQVGNRAVDQDGHAMFFDAGGKRSLCQAKEQEMPGLSFHELLSLARAVGFDAQKSDDYGVVVSVAGKPGRAVWAGEDALLDLAEEYQKVIRDTLADKSVPEAARRNICTNLLQIWLRATAAVGISERASRTALGAWGREAAKAS